jgi:hypothetical protein
MNRSARIISLLALSLALLMAAQRTLAAMSLPTQAITGTLDTCGGCGMGVGFACNLSASGTAQPRLLGISVTGTPGNSSGSGTVTVTNNAGTINLRWRFNLEGQVSAAPATGNDLEVVFPVPVPGPAGGSLTLTVPALGNSTSTVCANAVGIIF